MRIRISFLSSRVSCVTPPPLPFPFDCWLVWLAGWLVETLSLSLVSDDETKRERREKRVELRSLLVSVCSPSPACLSHAAVRSQQIGKI